MSTIVSFLLDNPYHVLVGIAVGAATLVTVHIFRFYSKRKNYPPGPFPLPLVGNFLSIRGKVMTEAFHDLSKKYGSVYTIHLGETPSVIITDPTIGQDVLKKHIFAGRPDLGAFKDIFFPEGSTDIALADFNKEFEVLRKVCHSAVRKYAVSDKLSDMVSTVVDDVMKEIWEKENPSVNGVDIKKYLILTLYGILSSAAFGRIYGINDPELLKWIDNVEKSQKLNAQFFAISVVPILKHVLRKTWRELMDMLAYQRSFLKSKYEEHVESFDGETIRDFTDALLAAKKEAEEEEHAEALKYLHPNNIMNSLLDLFSAGSETSRTTLWWAFLLMANNRDHQNRLRKEIKEVIGDQSPSFEHKAKCSFTSAFLAETLRYRLIVPFGIPHKATVDTEINGHKIQKGTSIMVSLEGMMNDKDTWGDPDVFRPERFLDSEGNFIPKPNSLYIPFSAGRRTCPGEKLALVDMFFVLARFLQKTEGMSFELEGGPGSADLSPDPQLPNGKIPREFKLLIKKVE